MVKTVLILILLAHGIGHILFLIPLWGIADWGQSTQSWLLGSETLAKLVGSLLWLIAIIAFTAASIGIISQNNWWRTAVVIGSIVSFIGVILFWQNPISSSAVFAGVVDVAVLCLLLIIHWPTVEMIGA